jgi:hypothetical protein
MNSSIVAADVISMDSELPLKKRDSISSASGTIPKLGMKMSKSEKLLTDIQVMRARGATEQQIVQKIFEDVPRCISGIYERLEYMFLQAISTGLTVVPSDENTGTGIRVEFGYSDANKFNPVVKWGEDGYKPISDIQRVISEAASRGYVITNILLDPVSYRLLRTSNEAKTLYGYSIGIANTLLIPTATQFDALIADELKVKLEVIDRSVRYEKNGKQTAVRPFAENTLVFLTTEQVGKLVYGILAEQENPVSGVEYQTIDNFILLSKYSKNDPLQEFTSSQALVLPVIENVDSIFLLNTQDGIEVSTDEVEGDATITIGDNTYNKAEVITALNEMGVRTSSNISDVKLIAKINTLSDEQKSELLEAITPI